MRWPWWKSLFATLSTVPVIAGYGTTVVIKLTYCPPPGTLSTPQPTIGPFAPYFLFVADRNGSSPEYLSGDGRLTTIEQASQFIITDRGELAVGNRIISTNQSSPPPWQVFGISVGDGIITTRFSSENDLLHWRNNAFPGGEALFCRSYDKILVSFSANFPFGCRPVAIELRLVRQLFEQPTSISVPTRTSSLPTSADGVVTTSSSRSSASVPSTTTVTTTRFSSLVITGSLPTSINTTIASTSKPNDVPSVTTIDSSISSGVIDTTNGNAASSTMSLEVPVSSIVTSSTLDGGMSSPTNPSGETSIPSGLTTTTLSVSTIPLATTTSLSTSKSAFTNSESTTYTTASGVLTTPLVSQSIPSFTTQPGTQPATQSTSIAATTSSVDSSTISIVASSQNEPTTRSTTESTTTIATQTTNTITTTSITTALPQTSCPTLPVNSALCPQQNKASLSLSGDKTCYGILCSTTLSGIIITSNSTTANNLRACAGFCSLYNLAIPYGCRGVNYLGATVGNRENNCLLFERVDGQTGDTVGVDSVRLVYVGYPRVERRNGDQVGESDEEELL